MIFIQSDMVKGVKTAVQLIKRETIKELLSKPFLNIQTILAKTLMMSCVIPSKTSTLMQRYFYSTQKPGQGKNLDQPSSQVSSQITVQQLKTSTENDKKEQNNNSKHQSGKDPQILQKQQLLEQRKEIKQNVGAYEILIAMQAQKRQERKERQKRQRQEKQERKKRQEQEKKMKFGMLATSLLAAVVGVLGVGNFILYIYQRPYIKEDSANKTAGQIQTKSIMDQKAKKQKIEEQITLKIDKLIRLVTSQSASGEESGIKYEFISDSLNEKIKQFINIKYYNQVLKVIYGRPGIGKSASILQYGVNKFDLKEPFLYLTFNTLETEKGYKGHQDLSLIIQIFSDQNLKKQFLQKLKAVQDIKLSKDYYFTLVIDQINKLAKCHQLGQKEEEFRHLRDQSSKFITKVYQLNSLRKIHVVLVSSDKEFARSKLVLNPGIRIDKFVFLQAQITKNDVQIFLKKFIQNQEIVSQLLSYHDNKRDLLPYVEGYLSDVEESNHMNAKKKLIQKLKEGVNEKQKEITKQVPKLKIGNKQILLKICFGNPLSHNDLATYEILIQKNIIYDEKSFRTKMLLKGFEKYYNAQMKEQKKKPVKCTSRQTY